MAKKAQNRVRVKASAQKVGRLTKAGKSAKKPSAKKRTNVKIAPKSKKNSPETKSKIKARAVPKKTAVKLTPFLLTQQKKLQELRDALLDQMQDVAQGNLRAPSEGGGGAAFGQHMGDAGSDAYERDFALSLLSQEQDSLYEIEEALRRIENGTYGVCEKSGNAIPKARLNAIPWARYTVECQAEMEKLNSGRRRWESTPQFMDTSETGEEEEEEESDEEIRPKMKE